MAPSIACWSMVHGFARLAIDGTFGLEVDAAAMRANAHAVIAGTPGSGKSEFLQSWKPSDV